MGLSGCAVGGCAGGAVNIEFLGDFGYIAKNRSLTAAAREIGVAQPVLSKRLASAERELGVELVERASGVSTVRLTPAGETFLEASLQIRGIYEQMRSELARQRRGAGRTVQVGVSARQPVYGAGRLIREVLKARGSVELKWVIDPKSIVFDALREGAVDAVIEYWSPMADVEGLLNLPLACDGAVVAVRGDDPLARRDSLTGADLRDVRFLSVANQTAYAVRKHLHSAAASQEWVPFFEPLSYDSTSIMLAERLAPGHAALLPAESAAYYRAQLPDVRFVPVDDPTFAFDQRLFWRPDAPAAVREVVEAAQEAVNRPVR